MEKVIDRLRDFWLKPSVGYPLAALRIVIGYMVLFESLACLPNIDDLYGQMGYFQAHLMDALVGASLPGLSARWGVSPEAYSLFLRGLYALQMLLGASFLVGFQTRRVGVGLWLTQTLIVNSGYVSVYGVHRYLHNLIFLAMWMPMARVWSVDQWRHPQPVTARSGPTLGLRLVQIFILMTYVDAGLAKSAGTDWWNGEAIWNALNLPEFRQFDFAWLAQLPWLAKALSRATLFLETFYIIGVWIPRLGRAWVFAIIGMHLGIAFFMGLTLFGTSMALVNVALFLVPASPSRFFVFDESLQPVQRLFPQR
jgi:hypothetical protein